jgi:hypothetical protein
MTFVTYNIVTKVCERGEGEEEIISLSTGKSGGKVAAFLPPDRLFILKHFHQGQ